jgi:DNA-binding winged helix-turn-helix (wHTH) protein
MIAARELSNEPPWSEPVLEPHGGNVEELRFRDYRLLPASRTLLKGCVPVAIGSRAFDILDILLQARGCIVGKREIVSAVWPTTIVEESNLRFQVAQLRKSLGKDQDLIKTIPGRGYLFALEGEAAATSSGSPGLVELIELDTRRGARALPKVQLHTLFGDEPAPILGGLCPEAQRLLKKLLGSLEEQHRGAVIVLVQIAGEGSLAGSMVPCPQPPEA